MRIRLPALAAVSGAAVLAFASPADAALTLVPGGTCSLTVPNPDAVACAGAFDGNLNNNSSIADLNAALDLLPGGFPGNVAWSVLDPTKALFSAGSGTTINFAQTLFGRQTLSLHFGGGGTGLGSRTILYVFDFGVTGRNSIDIGINGFSNAVLVPPAIPEPGTWAMMLMGFGAVGYAIRRRKIRAQFKGGLPQLA